MLVTTAAGILPVVLVTGGLLAALTAEVHRVHPYPAAREDRYVDAVRRCSHAMRK